MSTETKVAVVAGGTAGVGRATVDRLVKKGYTVGVLARGTERLAELERIHGDSVFCLSCDVSDARTVSKAAVTIDETCGPIRVWVNSAMLTSFSPFPDMTPEEFERIVAATFLGVVNGTRAALAHMEPRGRGQIVNVGSGLAYRSVPYQSAYCASKHAINGFTASIRTELIRHGSRVDVSLVQLPAINTPQFDWALNRMSMKPQPAPPIFQPGVAADAVMRAISEGGREYFVGSSVLRLVFANMVLPARLDRKLADAGAEMQKSKEAEPGGRPHNLEDPMEDLPSTPTGRFGAQAKEKGLIVDADRMRLAVFGALPVAGLVVGLLLG